MQNDLSGNTTVHGPRAFGELDEVALARAVYVESLHKE